jgi:hypothetical protein
VFEGAGGGLCKVSELQVCNFDDRL